VSARSLLYTPGDRADLHAKALASGADAVIFDLEDAVAAEAKDAAVRAVTATVERVGVDGPGLWVRVEPSLLEEQLDTLAPGLGALRGIVVPKASRALLDTAQDALARVERDAGVPASALRVIALLETADAVLEVREIARAPRVAQLAVGEVDLGASLGMAADASGWDVIRTQVVLASAAADLDGPIAPVHRHIHDDAGLAASCQRFANEGYRARTILSPRQVDIVNAHFGPTEAQLAWARSVVRSAQAPSAGAVTLTADGEMIDAAVVRRAASLLENGRGVIPAGGGERGGRRSSSR
jgi:citrate lyase subunit beta / citryl-CoA lyase